MKRKIRIAALILAVGITAAVPSGCKASDSAELEQRIADLEARVTALETLINENNGSIASASDDVAINPSPDKYTWYIKDYVGKNLASFGYTSLSNDRMDSYGAGYIKLVLNAEDGSYVDYENEEELQKYVVISQNIAPNSEMKYTFQTDSDGKEYDNLVASQTYEEIELTVKKIADAE